MKTPKHSLRKIVTFLNNSEEEGGFWLPNIQRPFVWSEEQTCRLFDSIMREYPISTLLVWKTKKPIRCRKFIDNFVNRFRTNLTELFIPENSEKKCLVLDGQQRLQSLFIGLKGSYEGKELFLDVLSGEVSAPDDVKFEFAFLDSKKASFPWIKFKDIIFSELRSNRQTERIIKEAPRKLTADEEDRISDIVSTSLQTFLTDDGISYQELDSTENYDLYNEDDVVEIFIRANSGGTLLGKSELLFSLLSSAWDSANDNMEALLGQLNRHGFQFTRDFVLKTCLTILGHGARYEVDKFRKPGVRETIENQWDEITDSIKSVLDFIRGKTYVQCDRTLSSYNVLIPLVYLRYHFREEWERADGIETYLIRSLLTKAFSGTPDQLIDEITRELKSMRRFDLDSVFDVIRSKNRSLKINEQRLWAMGYQSDGIHLLFNLWYQGQNLTPSYHGNLLEIDHIFPQSLLGTVKDKSPDTGKMSIMRYKKPTRDQLANCMLLTKSQNGPGGKSDKSPEAWFSTVDEGDLDIHLIPKDEELWKLENFEMFIEERKKLIRDKFGFLLD